jgi:hypothetical protein
VPMPVETDVPTWKSVAIAALGLIQILFVWIAKGFNDEQKSQADRLEKLERTYITRGELENDIALMRADNLRMNQETRADSLRMHASNESYLQRIEDKVERGGHTRHDIRDSVNAMQLMLKASLQELKQRDRERK